MDSNTNTTNGGVLVGSTLQQTDVNIQTPEQEEEIKLKAKYPNTNKPGGSQFILKMLTKGHKKYFDSGDYNMAKSRNKLNPPTTTLTPIAHNTSLTPSTPNSVNNRSSNDSSLFQSPNVSSNSSPFISATNQHNSFTNNHYLNDLLSDNLIDENTIGHEIPTAECLTARKHSTSVQSKLATNELS